ncbi:MAG: hypothetical protein MI740_17530 [Halanaerobiales bacterium]|nr:hypothetical protein [Halanaerobiales bacterium]
MKNKKLLINVFSIITLLLFAYCLFAYIYIQSQLTVTMPEPTRVVKILGSITIPALLIIGLYHLFLLVHALKILTTKTEKIFSSSVYIVMIVLSGITLLSDIILLSDISKEYLLWDVSLQWLMLYGFTVFHLLVVLAGIISVQKNPVANLKLFKEIDRGSDNLFLAIHYIAFTTGLVGISGIIFAMTGLVVPADFNRHFMLIAVRLALFPLTLIIVYWVVKMRNKPLREWIDEKQLADTSFGALASLFFTLPLYALICLIDLFTVWSLPVSFWVMLIFLIQLVVFSTVVIIRNRHAVN